MEFKIEAKKSLYIRYCHRGYNSNRSFDLVSKEALNG